MDINKQLKNYRYRLVAERWLKASSHGGAVGLFAVLIAQTYSRFSGMSALPWFYVFVGFSCFGIWTILRYILFDRPNLSQVAKRIDSLGLEERISTMVAYRDNESFIHSRQRADALDKLTTIAPKSLKIMIPRQMLMVCLVLILLLLVIAMLPANAFHPLGGSHSGESMETQETLLMQNILGELHQRIEQSDITQEEKEKLLEQLEMLEGSLDKEVADLTALAKLEQASQEILDKLALLEQVGSLVDKLMAYGCLYELGEGISLQSAQLIGDAFLHMEDQLHTLGDVAQKAKIEEICKSMTEALMLSEISQDERLLYNALSELGQSFQQLLDFGYDKEDLDIIVSEELSTAKERVLQALFGEIPEDTTNGVQGEGNLDTSSMSAGKTDDNQQTDSAKNSEAQVSSSDMLYHLGGDGIADAGNREKQKLTTNGTVYEPTLDQYFPDNRYVPGAVGKDGSIQRQFITQEESDGIVDYSQVYGIYYAQSLDQLEDEELSPTLRRMIEEYLQGL